jgi:hypothetical protein
MSRPTIEERFAAFHAANPDVYDELVRLARRARARGHRRMGIELCFGALRWNRLMQTTGERGFKLNDHFTSRYSRLIQEQEPDLAGFFETRELRSA